MMPQLGRFAPVHLRYPLVLLPCLLILYAAPAADQHTIEDGPVLNENVEALHFERMAYPIGAKLTHLEGMVVLRASVDAQGRVSAVAPLSGPRALLSETEENLKKWTFSRPRRANVIVVYWFRLRGLCELPCPSGFEFYPPNLVVVTTGNALATP
jgi:hypothetical protein